MIVFYDYHERVNYIFIIFCLARVVSCVERLDRNGLKFSVKPSIPYIELTDLYLILQKYSLLPRKRESKKICSRDKKNMQSDGFCQNKRIKRVP